VVEGLGGAREVLVTGGGGQQVLHVAGEVRERRPPWSSSAGPRPGRRPPRPPGGEGGAGPPPRRQVVPQRAAGVGARLRVVGEVGVRVEERVRRHPRVAPRRTKCTKADVSSCFGVSGRLRYHAGSKHG
jgi:hypothetical protein